MAKKTVEFPVFMETEDSSQFVKVATHKLRYTNA